MRDYETTIVLDASLEEEALTREIQKLQEAIATGGGNITKLEKWGVKRFAHLLKKQRQGYYLHIRFTGPPELPKKLETGYKLNDQILRYLTVLSEPVKGPAAPETPPDEQIKNRVATPEEEGETSTSPPEADESRPDSP